MPANAPGAARVRVLGPVELLVGDHPVGLGGVRSRALVAALAVRAGEVVSTERLIDLVWGEDPPKTVANQLQIAVHQVRQAITAAGVDAHRTLRTDAGGYTLDLTGGLTCDLDDFRRHAEAGRTAAEGGDWATARDEFQAALTLWTGTACEGVEALGIAATASVLEEERRGVLESRMVADLSVGDPGPVIAEATAILAADPLRERVRHLLVLAHTLTGDDARARAEYDDGRAAVADALGIDPGPDLRALAEEIDAPERALTRVQAWITGPASDPARPRLMGLPSDTRHFVGRHEELAVLTRALGADGPAVVTVVGLGGVGKTALAVRAAAEAAERFPDGCLFTELRGADPDPRAPSAVLGSFLQALGLPEKLIPDDPGERLARYRELLAGRRILVVLDNALDAGQVRDLLPVDPANTAVVTSRGSLSGLRPAVEIALASLPESDAVELLGRMSGSTGDDADDLASLASLAGRLPLALRILGARLARRRGLTPGRLVQRLGDEQRRLRELSDGDRTVRSCFDIGYRRLGADEQAMLRAAAWLPVSEFSLATLAGMLGLTHDEAAARAADLTEAQFLTVAGARPPGPERYRIHDLVRLFTREESADAVAERTGVLTAGCLHLLASALLAQAGLGLSRYPVPEPPAGLPEQDAVFTAMVERAPGDWYDDEWELLVAAVSVARDIGRDDIAWRLAATVTARLPVVYRPEDADRVWSTVEDLADTAEPEARVALLLAHAAVLWQRERLPELWRTMRIARRLALRRGDLLSAACAAVAMSDATVHLSHYRTAHAAALWAVRLLDRPGTRDSAQRAWALLSMCRARGVDAPDEDLAPLGEAMRIFRGVGDRLGEANAVQALGHAHKWGKRYQEAADHYREAIVTYTSLGHVEARLNATRSLADVLRLRKDFDGALEVLDRMNAEAEDFRRRLALTAGIRLKGSIRHEQGRHTEALAHFEEALARIDSGATPEMEALILRGIGEIRLELRQWAEAREAAQAALAVVSPGYPRRGALDEIIAAADRGEKAA